MLIPSKYEDISTNLLIIGSYIITSLNSKNYNVEELYQKLIKDHSVNLDQYFNALTFLWLAEIITVDSIIISLVKNVTEKTLHNA